MATTLLPTVLARLGAAATVPETMAWSSPDTLRLDQATTFRSIDPCPVGSSLSTSGVQVTVLFDNGAGGIGPEFPVADDGSSTATWPAPDPSSVLPAGSAHVFADCRGGAPLHDVVAAYEPHRIDIGSRHSSAAVPSVEPPAQVSSASERRATRAPASTGVDGGCSAGQRVSGIRPSADGRHFARVGRGDVFVDWPRRSGGRTQVVTWKVAGDARLAGVTVNLRRIGGGDHQTVELSPDARRFVNHRRDRWTVSTVTICWAPVDRD